MFVFDDIHMLRYGKGIGMSDESVIRPNRNGLPAIRGTRLTVYSIMDHYFSGAALEEISDFYRIPLEDATGAIEYINSHMTELMPTYRQMLERDARGNSPDVNQLLSAAHERVLELRSRLERERRATEDAPLAG